MWVYTLLPKVLNMSLTAGIVILYVLIARILLKKAPKIFSYALWAVVFFRLICPVSFSSEFSLLGIFHTPAVINNSMAYIPADIVHTERPQVDLPIPAINEAINHSLPQGEEQAAADPLEWRIAAATVLWLSGIAAMLTYSAVSLLLLHRKLIGAVRLRENIYLADHIPTAFVIGVIRPKIFLPSTLADQEQGYILLHEQTHIRRLDHIFKVIAFLALSVHWFNPLVWVAFVCAVKDMEISCDEHVLKKMGEEIKQAYSTSLLSLAAGRPLINGSPLAFGEGAIKERIRNAMNFKKPAAWVTIVSVLLVAALSIGFAANRADPDNPSDWDKYNFPGYLYDRVTFHTEAAVYPTSFEAINAVLTNTELETGLICGKAFTLVKQVGVDWRTVPFAKGVSFHDLAIDLPIGNSETYRLAPDLFSVKLDAGNYRLVTDVRYANEPPPPTVRKVWADFTIAAPDSTGWQELRIGMMRDEVHTIMGEPIGMLSGLFGDIYLLENGSGIIIYYDAALSVYHIKLTEPEASPLPFAEEPADTSALPSEAPSAISEVPNEALELIADADLDRDGRNDYLYLDRSSMSMDFDVTLRVLNDSGNEIWSEAANTAHAGWNSLFLCKLDGMYYLLRYHPTIYQGVCSYVYTLFTLEDGGMNIVQTNKLDFDINGTEELDTPQMLAFAEEVNALLGKSTLLMSTQDGNYAFGPSSAEAFFERYSWLDDMPKLYSDSDDLEARLIKYSDYAIASRKLSEEKTYTVTEAEITLAKSAALSYYETTVFKGRVSDIIWIADTAKYQSAIIPQKIKDIVIAFYITIPDNPKRMIVLTKEINGDWEVINEGV